jgi:aminocarboxymuconate-semialdehyde decarboxylase
MSSRREFLKDLAGATMGIVFVNRGLANAASSFQKAGGKAKRRGVVVAGRRVKTIDVHGHCFVPEIWELMKDFKEAQPLKQFVEGPLSPKLNVNTLESRLQQMDEWGIDMQAVSVPPEYNYWADRDLACRIVQIQNHKIAELCATHPDRFVGIGAVALQHPDLAAEQMEEGTKKLGLRGFEIGGSINGEELRRGRKTVRRKGPVGQFDRQSLGDHRGVVASYFRGDAGPFSRTQDFRGPRGRLPAIL